VKFAAAIAAARESQPHARPDKVAGRLLLADGDALAYACGGNDETPTGLARRNLADKIDGAMRAAGASAVTLLVTSGASHKGHRYAIARVKPYQGKRDSGRKPRNWQFLRTLIEQDPRAVVTDTLEADDLFHVNSSRLGYENVAILTQDKDMRMVPGWHLHWDTNALVRVTPDTWELYANDKLYGRKWFWMQMLHGDATDYVPGLPKYVRPDGKAALCGEVTAAKLLAPATDEAGANAIVSDLYRGSYGDRWLTEMLEQACLLWMRRSDRLFDCCSHGGPLDFYAGTDELDAAMREVRSRVVDL